MTMKEACERCKTALAADGDALVCSYECTFCPACSAAMVGVCPNCGGELVRRPRRRPKGEAPALIDPETIMARHRGRFADLLGIRIVRAEPDRLVAELPYRFEITTPGDRVHGGAIMAFADTLGANATAINIPPGSGTTTIESKTNFFSAGTGGVLRAETTPLHKGRSTHVWTTRISDETGKLVAQVTQTQMVLTKR
ncbi:MAG TPA: DUF1272 domain-containing protein [Terriglobales bacterium]|nr:DUF1272 domain-containing protein [Terriglobales bacterium]